MLQSDNVTRRQWMSNLPKCPKRSSEFTYENGKLIIRPECAPEWPKSPPAITEVQRVDGDHDIDCRIDGIGATTLKPAFVKKARTCDT